jgi:hypothetical protein
LEKLPQRNSHRIFSRVDGFLAYLLRATILAVLQQPALVNAFQISAGAMSSDPGEQSFLQELRKNFAHALGVRHKAS